MPTHRSAVVSKGDSADASPTRRLFIEMLTSDISADEAILDLIDNAIDSLIQSGKAPINQDLLFAPSKRAQSELPTVKIQISSSRIEINDNCGGISLADARNRVFRLGRTESREGFALGVYGIGMKRALFKIGNAFIVRSRAKGEAGFTARLESIDDWSKIDRSKWEIPLTHLDKPLGPEKTDIVATSLRDDIKLRIQDVSFIGMLRQAIATTYSVFLNRFVSIEVNGELVKPQAIPLGRSKEIQPGVEKRKLADLKVEVFIYVGIADASHWKQETAGWYVLCNGRLIVHADKTSLTGWAGGGELPRYVSKFRGFIGVVMFFATQPENLPWRTTKRGLNVDSLAYQKTKPAMISMAKPVITYLNSLQKGDSDEETLEQRQVAQGLKHVDFRDLQGELKGSSFRAFVPPKKLAASTVRVQFDITTTELRRARKILGESDAPASRIGREAFEDFLRRGE